LTKKSAEKLTKPTRPQKLYDVMMTLFAVSQVPDTMTVRIFSWRKTFYTVIFQTLVWQMWITFGYTSLFRSWSLLLKNKEVALYQLKGRVKWEKNILNTDYFISRCTSMFCDKDNTCIVTDAAHCNGEKLFHTLHNTSREENCNALL